MKTEAVPTGANLVDSYPFSVGGTAAQAKAIAAEMLPPSASQVRAGMYGYLGLITPDRVKYITDAGMGFMPVTLGGHYDGDAAVVQCRALGLPPGVTVCLDLEGMIAFHTDPIKLAASVNLFADKVDAAGFMAGLYVGVPQPFTSDELWKLKVHRYWRGQGSVRDRNGDLAEPTRCGWCVTQMYPSVLRGGVLVDIDCVGQDYLGRTPNWMVA